MTIRQIIKRGQDTLARIRVHQRPALVRRIFPPANKPWPIYGYPPVQYPKSLGEVCIELALDEMNKYPAVWIHVDSNGIKARMFSASCHWISLHEYVKGLRRLMYHREKR